MKTSNLIPAFTLIATAICSQSVFAAKDLSKTIGVFMDSPQAERFFENAYGYAVFPTVGEGAAIIGGTYGEGQLYQGDKLTGEVTLLGLSIGPQLGGNAYSEIIFFKDKRAYDEFASGKYTFNADAKVIAIAASAQAEAGGLGYHASANTKKDIGAYTANYEDGMAVLIRGKNGFMAEASLGGQHFSVKPFNASGHKNT